MIATDDRFVIRSGEFVDGAGPEFVAVGKLVFLEGGDSLQLGNRWGRKNLVKDRLQLGDARVEHSQQPFAVDPQRFQSYFLARGQGGDGLRIGVGAPELKVGFQRPEQCADGLPHGRDQVGGTGIQVGFGTEESLRQAEASGNGGDGERDFGTRAARLVGPNFLSQKMIAELAGEGEFGGVRLLDPLAVEGASHGINQVADQQPVEFVAAVEGGHEIEFSLVDGAQQALDPVGFDGGRFRRDDRASGGTQKVGGGQDGAQRRAGGRLSGIFRADAVQSAQGVNVGRDLGVIDGGAPDQIRGLIARAAIGVDDYGAFAGEKLQQSSTDGLHDLANRGGIVVGRHTDEDVSLADVNQLAQKLICQNAFLGQISCLARVRCPQISLVKSQFSVLRYLFSNLAQTEPVELVGAQG